MVATHGNPPPIQLQVAGAAPVPLSFVERGPGVYLVATDPTARWAREAIRAPVEVLFPDGRIEYRIGRLVIDPRVVDEVLRDFREKYGDSAWGRFFQGRKRVLMLEAAVTPGPRTTEAVLREEFDSIAEGYAAAVAHDPFRQYLRTRSERQFERIFAGRDPILELGPGAGIETLGLLRAGHRVLAVDVSPRMLDALRRRADAAGLSEKLETRLGSIGELETLLGDRPKGSFGGALSTFGALNLEPHLDRLPAVLGRALAPGAPFFAGILNRWAFCTVAFLLATGHPRVAWGRLGTPVLVGGALYPLEVRPFTAREFARPFHPEFDLEAVESASVLVPPYGSAPLHSFWGGSGRRRLSRFDERLARTFPFRESGEYVFVVLRRAS